MSWLSSVGKDGYHLARALANGARAKGTAQSFTAVRPILLDHARQSNRVATSMLKVDKEIGLIRYWGLWGYLRQRLSPSFSSGASQAIENRNDEEGSEKKARISFMITSAMKADLADRLGYDPEKVKQMTPLQASLLLNNNVPAEEMESRLPILEKEHIEEEEREQQRRHEKEQLRLLESLHANAGVSPSTNDVYAMHRDPISTTEHGYISANIMDDGNYRNDAWGRGSTWYEVIETRGDGESSRVGLYLVEEEAQLGLETRQLVADRKANHMKYELRKISGDTLFADNTS